MTVAAHHEAPLAAMGDEDGTSASAAGEWPVQEPQAGVEGSVAIIAEEQAAPASDFSTAPPDVPVPAEATTKPDSADTDDEFSDVFSDVFQGNLVKIANVKDRLRANRTNGSFPQKEMSEGDSVQPASTSGAAISEKHVEDTGGENCKDDAATITSLETKAESSDKRRERRKLRRSSPRATRDSVDEALAQTDGAAGPVPNDEASSIITSNSKETLDTASTDKIQDAVSSDRRRERRRKLMRGRSDTANNTTTETSQEGVGAGENGEVVDVTRDDDNTIATIFSKGTLETTSTLHSSDKRRERRKFRDQQLNEEDNADDKPLQEPASMSPEPLVKTRRQKLAERVARGAVPIPRALLQAKPGGISQPVPVTENGVKDVDETSNRDASVVKKTPPQTPTSKAKKSQLSGANSPATPADSSSPSSERLIVTPTNEVEMKLVEAGASGVEGGEMEEPPTLPNLKPAPSPDRNEARRNRRLARHLRKGPATGRDRVEMAFNSAPMDEDEEEAEEDDTAEGDQTAECDLPSEDWMRDGKGKSSAYVSAIVKSTLVNALEKEHRDALRSPSPTSSFSSAQPANDIDPEISKQVAEALEKANTFTSAEPNDAVDPEVSNQIPGALEKANGADRSSNGAVRSSSPTSSFTSAQPVDAIDPEVSKQIATALERARKQKQSKDKEESMDLVEESIVDEKEAKELFPDPDGSFATTTLEESKRATTTTTTDSAWDANGASGINAVLESSKAQNKESAAAVDGRPLLHLETISSDQNRIDEGTLEEDASSKLQSQQQRLAMYTSGEGFGVGEDSSVDNDNESHDSGHASEDEGEENVGIEVIGYEDMNNIIDDAAGQQDEGDEALGSIQYVPPAGGYNNNAPTFSIAGESNVPRDSRARRWDQNPDAMSDADDGSELFDVKSGTTSDGSAVFGLRFVGSGSVSGNSTSQQYPTPPQSPFKLTDPDATPKIGSKAREAKPDKDKGSPVKLLKIPPPPAEKLRQWEESKGLARRPSNSGAKDATPGSNAALLVRTSSSTSDVSKHRRAVSLNNLNLNNLSYKVQLPKSPLKKAKAGAHTITEELDLDSHPRMAEKIALASSKAARTFEENYSHQHHARHHSDEGSDAKNHPHATPDGSDRFFCAGDDPPVDQDHDNPLLSMATVGLVRGAFSPWKIRDEDDGSSIASSSIAPNVVASKSLRGHPPGQKDDSLNESFEVSLGGEIGALTGVLQWLFEDVLLPNSPIVAAFSAFDIDASTTVQADRLLAIAKDNECFNTICDYVAANVVVREASEVTGTEDDPPQILAANSAEDTSVSTYESSAVERGQESTIEAFNVPIPAHDTSHSSDTRPSPEVLAANFIGFLQQISTASGLPSPFGDSNPFLQSVMHSIASRKQEGHPVRETRTMQDLIFSDEDAVANVFLFLRKVCKGGSDFRQKMLTSIDEGAGDTRKQSIDETPTTSNNVPGAIPGEEMVPLTDHAKEGRSATLRRRNNSKRKASHKTHKQSKGSKTSTLNLNLVVPDQNPSPFETAVWNDPSIVLTTLSFLGDPVAVCVMKRLNVFCNRVVVENQHVLMRDAVRIGGMSKYVRPSFWLWVTERSDSVDPIPLVPSRRGFEHTLSSHTSTSSSVASKYKGRDFAKLKDIGANGKWQHIIERDVTRSFGNLPPHKTGARYRQDSIVRALVSFGREEVMRNGRGYQGMDKLPEDSEAKHFKLSSRLDRRDDSSNCSNLTPTDTVSDWGGISPVGSFVSEDPSSGPAEGDKSMQIVSYENGELLDASAKQALKLNVSQTTSRSDVSDPVLSGNTLTGEMKVDLQDKLRSILHALAARHEAVGYCQGMDYVVAHLLRVLQDTILLRQVQRSVPRHENVSESVEDWRTISSDELRARMSAVNSQSAVVEEVVFGVMDTFFSTYGLQHMYWPELRCLKTCCRVFERVIKQKLPVLADHFEHHELNVGLFALGWFQTLFLYLPSMPSTTVCHMWDIWLVERSFKIFFRVGTAILFLSQPTLLNHDLEGMMTYLNTFPDATLLRRDILIPCALQIKITNRMLVEIEMEIAKTNQAENSYFR